MKVTDRKAAWSEVNKIFPAGYEHDTDRSERAGYPIYYVTAANMNAWISDLGNRLEVNMPNGKIVNIWIEAPAAADPAELTEERKEVVRRLQRATYQYTEEYVKELGNKEKEDAAIKAMKEAPDGGQIRCMVLTAENNAKVMMDCIKESIRAVDILRNPEEDVDEWMLSGIMAMLDRVNQLKYIPFDLPASICGLLCAEYR